ncbi:uncharacterized protein P884DRAFT_263629 [Thermothelomyces heterothallicus CBS 202.75]|uniref:uncharacterized protein n=1 Tax=Thermothelomyces heterothallicus CBS 202.75 TaxID=1149848 RepID=UPI003742E382
MFQAWSGSSCHLTSTQGCQADLIQTNTWVSLSVFSKIVPSLYQQPHNADHHKSAETRP